MLCWILPTVLLAFLAASACCWCMVSLVCTRTLRMFFFVFFLYFFFFAKLLSNSFPYYRGESDAWGFSFPDAGLSISLCWEENSLQDLTFFFVRETSVHFFQSFKGSFNGSTVIWSINHSAQFYVVCKLIAGALSAVIRVTKQDVKTQNLLNLSKSDLAMVWDRSFSSCGCIPSCPIDLCLFCLFKNPLTWPYSTEGYLIQGFCTALRDLGLLNASLTSKHQGKEGIVYPGLVYVLYQQAPSPVLE